MTAPSEQREKAGTGAVPNLGQRAFGGALWSLGQTAGTKAVTIGAQFILLGLLSWEDFGLFAEVLLVVTLCNIGQQIGIGEILIRRHRHFEKLAGAASWISFFAGLLGAGAVVLFAPFAHHFFKDASGLPPLLLIAAIGLPFDSLAVIPQAKLRMDLRFRALALLGTMNQASTAILSVALAALNHYSPTFPVAGAMCLVLPRPIMSAVTMFASYACVRVPISRTPRFSRWPLILRDCKYFFGTSILNTLLTQGDYLLTGIFFTTEQLGAYYFAFNLSTQTAQLVSANLTSVLLPSFAKLDRAPQRQREAYLKVCSTIAIVGVLMCIVQVELAGPLLRTFFGHKRDEAIPLFEILTIGMLFLLPTAPGMSLMQAQGKYRRYLTWTATCAVTFLISVMCGVLSGHTQGIAIADSIFYSIFGPLGVMIPLEISMTQLIAIVKRVYAYPFLSGIVAAAIAYLTTSPMGSYPLVRGILASLVTLIVYAGVISVVARSDVRELISRVQVYLLRIPMFRPKEKLSNG